MTIRHRARDDAQKEARRQDILDAAWALFKLSSFEGLNISDVARTVGLAKGTVYLYFKTKEALFLEIQRQQFENLFDLLDAELKACARPVRTDRVVDIFTRVFGAEADVRRLFAIVHVVLERNIDYADALAFKTTLRQRINQTAPLLEACLGLAAGTGAQVLLQVFALVIGTQHLSDAAPVVRDVLEHEPGFSMFLVDFEHSFAESLRALLNGITRR